LQQAPPIQRQTLASIVHSHATTWHDGGVAMLLPSGEIVALAAERVGDRYKHSWSSRLAYEHLRSLPSYAPYFGGPLDRFIDSAAGLQTDGHHLYHAAGAFYGSGFDHAAVLVIDGQGPQGGHLSSTSIWRGDGSALSLVEELYPTSGHFAAQSLGHFYTAIGAMAGMTQLHDEGKTMALAAYGRPSRFLDFLRRFAGSNGDGGFRLDPRFTVGILANTLGRAYFGWEPPERGTQAVWDEFLELRGGQLPVGGTVSQDDADIAYAGQVILEEIVLGLVGRAHALVSSSNLCLAGGVALNCVANGRVVREGPFGRVFVIPAPGDDGQAIGKLLLEARRLGYAGDLEIKTAYYGPEYPASAVDAALRAARGALRRLPVRGEELLHEVAARLDRGQVVGWYQGRSELGPRALGHRSILADPRRSGMREHVNRRVKDREWYRPLAPIVIEERAADFFELRGPSPFMTIAVQVRPDRRRLLPSCTHVDGSARVQTLARAQDPRCHQLLRMFELRTGVPVLINTSFNRRGEPLVETPHDAVRAFESMALDVLALEDNLVEKIPGP
jgi:carbamoyltransferase